jgi:hypothetical protein
MARNVIVAACVLLAFLLTGCNPEAQIADPRERPGLPGWLSRVYPEPGAEGSVGEIQVDYQVSGPEQNVRLFVDGVDVTIYSTIQSGSLQYDVAQEFAPVELDPGPHRAAVELVNEPEQGEAVKVLDRFEWQFEVR